MQIEQDMVENNFSAVESKITALSPVSAIENNYKQFYSTYTKYYTDSLTSTDSTLLYTIAIGCPFTDGAIVYQARALYNSVYNASQNFEDNCVYVESRAMLNKPVENKLNALVYPNPTTGTLNVTVSDIDLSKVQMRICDMLGKTVYEAQIVLNSGMSAVDLDLNNGVYFIEILTPKKEKVLKEKLIINR